MLCGGGVGGLRVGKFNHKLNHKRTSQRVMYVWWSFWAERKGLQQTHHHVRGSRRLRDSPPSAIYQQVKSYCICLGFNPRALHGYSHVSNHWFTSCSRARVANLISRQSTPNQIQSNEDVVGKVLQSTVSRSNLTPVIHEHNNNNQSYLQRGLTSMEINSFYASTRTNSLRFKNSF